MSDEQSSKDLLRSVLTQVATNAMGSTRVERMRAALALAVVDGEIVGGTAKGLGQIINGTGNND